MLDNVIFLLPRIAADNCEERYLNSKEKVNRPTCYLATFLSKKARFGSLRPSHQLHNVYR